MMQKHVVTPACWRLYDGTWQLLYILQKGAESAAVLSPAPTSSGPPPHPQLQRKDSLVGQAHFLMDTKASGADAAEAIIDTGEAIHQIPASPIVQFRVLICHHGRHPAQGVVMRHVAPGLIHVLCQRIPYLIRQCSAQGLAPYPTGQKRRVIPEAIKTSLGFQRPQMDISSGCSCQ